MILVSGKKAAMKITNLSFSFNKKEAKRKTSQKRGEFMKNQVKKVLSDADQSLIVMVRG